MAEEQKFIIPLESNLELTTDDMVVNAAVPTFHFNDQISEAGIMANSFKFEGEGYIAGHNIYTFVSRLIGDAETNWPQGWISRLGDIWAIRDFSGTVASFTWNSERTIMRGLLILWERPDNSEAYTLSGETTRGVEFSIIIDVYSLDAANVPSGYSFLCDKINETTLSAMLSKNVDPNDILRWIPPRVISSDFTSIILDNISALGKVTKFQSDAGSITLDGPDLESFNINGLSLVRAVPGDQTNIAVKDNQISAVAVHFSTVDGLIWRTNTAPYYTFTENNEDSQNPLAPPPPISLKILKYERIPSLCAQGEAPDNKETFDRWIEDPRTMRDICSMVFTRAEVETEDEDYTEWMSLTNSGTQEQYLDVPYKVIRSSMTAPHVVTVGDNRYYQYEIIYDVEGHTACGLTDAGQTYRDSVVVTYRMAQELPPPDPPPPPPPLPPPDPTPIPPPDSQHPAQTYIDGDGNEIPSTDVILSFTVGSQLSGTPANGSTTAASTAISNVLIDPAVGCEATVTRTIRGWAQGVQIQVTYDSLIRTAAKISVLPGLRAWPLDPSVYNWVYDISAGPSGEMPGAFETVIVETIIKTGINPYKDMISLMYLNSSSISEIKELTIPAPAITRTFGSWSIVLDSVGAMTDWADNGVALPDDERYCQKVSWTVSRLSTSKASFTYDIYNRDLWDQPAIRNVLINKTNWDGIVVVDESISKSSHDLVVRLRDDTERHFVLQNWQMSGQGVATGATLTSVITVDSEQICEGNAQGVGVFTFKGSRDSWVFENADWYINTEGRDGAWFIYNLATLDVFKAQLGAMGMIQRRSTDIHYVSGENTVRYDFEYADDAYFIRAAPSAYIKDTVFVRDIRKNRGVVALDLVDREESALLEETIALSREPEEAEELANDKNDQQHEYWAITADITLESTGTTVRLLKHTRDRPTEILDTRFVSDFLHVNATQRIERWGVSCALDDLPRIWCIYVDTADGTGFYVKYIKARVGDLNYPPVADWLSAGGAAKITMRKRGTPAKSGALTYYSDNMTILQIVRASVISTSWVDNKFMMGIKYQRDMHQWTIKDQQIITGFGSVGPDGLITGNWLPAQCCGATGFIDTPMDRAFNFNTPGCYNVNGHILFGYSTVIGYVYGYKPDGSMLMQSELSSSYGTSSAESYTELDEIPVLINASFPIGDYMKMVLEIVINMPAQLIYSALFSNLPSLIRPSRPGHISIPGNIFSMFNVGLPGGLGRFLGVWGYCGYWHWASTWLTGPRTGQLVWNPSTKRMLRVQLVPNPLYDLMMHLAGMAVSALNVHASEETNRQSGGSDEPPTVIPGTEGEEGTFTKEQASSMISMLETGPAGSHSNAEIAAHAANIGVTDPSTIAAIQNGSWNANGTNTTWREGITALVNEGVKGTPATIEMPQTPTVSEMSGTAAPASGAIGEKTNSFIPKLLSSILSISGERFLSLVITAELACWDDIIPACFNKQLVYSGPGYYSIQLVRSARRMMNYHGACTHLCKGAIINPLGVVAGETLTILGTGLNMPPNIPISLPSDWGTRVEVNAKSEDMRWLGGQHLYLNGPIDKTNSVRFTEASLNLSLKESTSLLEPGAANTRRNDMGWTWSTIKKEVTAESSSSIILGNSCMLDADGFVPGGSATFSTPAAFDALINAEFGLWSTCVGDDVIHLSIDDTKIIDGTFTNIVRDGEWLVIGSMYNVVRTQRGCPLDLIRPYNILQGLRLNRTITNYVQGLQLYHAFDGYTSRIDTWQGITGGNIEELNTISQYLQFKEPFALHTMLPPSAFFGKFNGLPVIRYRHSLNIEALDASSTRLGTRADTRTYRVSIPVFFRRAAVYPAGIQTVGTYKLFVVDGITSLTTDSRTGFMRSLQAARDIMIYGRVYRAFNEYLSQADQQYGMLAFRDAALKLGQKALGADGRSILLFSKITRQLYKFTGVEVLQKINTVARVADLQWADFEFLRQELVVDAAMQLDFQKEGLIRFEELTPKGMIPLPHDLIDPIDHFGSECGFVIQGRTRAQCWFSIFNNDMLTSNLRENRGRWDKMPIADIRDFFAQRTYNPQTKLPDGYYWEPFRLATSFLGIDDSTDCQFEWVLTFAFTEWMYQIVGDKYVTVCVAAETSTPNGHIKGETTHIRLRNDMFRRQGDCIGYYTFRFNSRNGAGNSERLFIWCDGIMALRRLELIARPITTARTSPLLTQADFIAVDEL